MILIVPPASADGEAEYKYREGVMKAIGGHMSSIGAILRGQVHSENLALHAESMAKLAAIASNLFPEGSDVGKSEALPAIWEKPDEFERAMDDFVNAANGFAGAATSGSGVPQALRRLGGTCKGCHDDFREDH